MKRALLVKKEIKVTKEIKEILEYKALKVTRVIGERKAIKVIPVDQKEILELGLQKLYRLIQLVFQARLIHIQ